MLLNIGLVALVACNPPNPENDPPNIQLVSPEGDYDPEDFTTTYSADANVAFDMVFRLSDRDGDSPLSVTLFVDDTPDNTEDDAYTEIASATDLETGDVEIPANPQDPEDGETRIVQAVDVTLTVADGLPEGPQRLRALAADSTGIGEPREAIYDFQVNASISEPVPGITPSDPTAQDALSGDIVTPSEDPEGGTPYHEWIWRRIDPADPALELPPDGPGNNFPGALPAVNTAKGETWEFCVMAYESPDGSPPSDLDSVQSRTGCTSVEIGNSEPGAPAGIVVQPAIPTPADTLFCSVATDATDPDGDAVTYGYTWTVDGSAVITNGDDPWLSPHQTPGGSVVSCTVTAFDATGDTPLEGGNATSADVTLTAANLNPNAAASRIAAGEAGSFAGEHTAIAPLATFSGSAQECLVVGKPSLFEVGPPEVDGELVIYQGNGIGVSASTEIPITGDSIDAPAFGGPLASGDIDDDGADDLAATSTGVADSTVWLVYGGAVPPDDYTIATATFDKTAVTSTQPGFGSALAIGDVLSLVPDADLVVGTVAAGTANTVRIFSGDTLGPSAPDVTDADAAATITAPGTDDGFGSVLHASADIDGDGSADLVVSDPGAATSVYVFAGGSGLTGTVPLGTAVFTITATGGEAGASLASADIDGNGVDDLIVGAPAFGGGQVGIFFDSTVAAGGSVAFGQADILLQSATAMSRFGDRIQAFDDPSGLFGDSLVVGAPDGTGVTGGSAYIFDAFTLTTESSPIAATLANTVWAGSNAGEGLSAGARAKDIDNDGFPDLVLVAPTFTTDEGRVYVKLSSTP